MAKENSLKSQIYTAVFQSIISGEIPTDSIISEKSLVERYHVSKSPVREALVELCSEGVLRSIPRYGYAVVRLGPRDVRDILAFRAVLEPGCLAGVLERSRRSSWRSFRSWTGAAEKRRRRIFGPTGRTTRSSTSG